VHTKSSLQESRILDAAGKLFGRQRFHEVRMEDIATEADVGKGTIYRYFKDKEDLFTALLQRSSEQLLNQLRQALGQATRPRARLEAIVGAVIAFFDEHPHLSDLIQRSEVLAGRDGVMPWQRTRNELVHLIRGVFAEANVLGEFVIHDEESMSLMLLGGLRGIIRFGSRPRAADLAQRLATIFLEGADCAQTNRFSAAPSHSLPELSKR